MHVRQQTQGGTDEGADERDARQDESRYAA